jgi:lambda family phage portal protein
MGVEIDGYGRPVAYHVSTSHPAEGAIGRERVPAKDIFHIFAPDRPEQTRGVPWMHAILLSTQQLLAFEDAATVAARIGASKMGFFTPTVDPQEAAALLASSQESESTVKPGDPTDPALRDDRPKYLMGAEPGQFDLLPPGWDLKQFDPAFPDAAFEPFVKALTRRIASGLDVAYHNLSGDMTDVNYSSARIAELDERDAWLTLQSWMIEAFVMPVALDWLELALLNRAIVMDTGKALPADADRDGKFSGGLEFRGRRWSWVDPQKEVDAAVRAIHNGLRSRTDVVTDAGGDFDDLVVQLADETQALEDAGVPFELPKSGGPPPPAEDPPAPPAD